MEGRRGGGGGGGNTRLHIGQGEAFLASLDPLIGEGRGLISFCICGQGEDFLASLEPVVGELAVEVAAAKLDRKGLAALSAGLQQFQENALGVNVNPVEYQLSSAQHDRFACLCLQ